MIYYLILDLSAVLICGWTGYFLVHDSKSVSALNLSVLLIAYAVIFILMAFMRRVPLVRIIAAPESADRLPFAIRLPIDILLFLALIIIAMEPFVEERIEVAVAFAPPVAIYAGLMRALRAARQVERRTFNIVFAASAIALLGYAGYAFASDFAYRTVIAILLVWPVVRIAWYGRLVTKEATKARINLFAVSVLASTGFVAGAVLAMQVEAEREQVMELTWVVIPVALSVILVRLAPRMWQKDVSASDV